MKYFHLIIHADLAYALIFAHKFVDDALRGVLKETGIIIAISKAGDTEEQLKENLEELSFLAFTAGATIVKSFTQKMNYPNPKTYIGSGKLKELADYIREHTVDMVICDDELSPAQIRNIERALDVKVLDRTNLILDIFATRAKTSQAKTQVELAQSEYLLPRLTRLWTHLSRQKGGIGLRGPGETEIETDRRIIRDRIALLRKKLDTIEKQNRIQRKSRGQKIRVALVGYTNAGKSTLMNVLSKSDVFAENKLFATLDTTVRNVVLDGVTFLLSDTVGFIRKLPHRLVESFKSTLDEAREADLLLHVIDISHPNFLQQIETVRETISDMGAAEIPVLYVFNKTDKLKQDFFEELSDSAMNMKDQILLLKKSYLAKEYYPALFISAINKEGIPELRSRVLDCVKDLYKNIYPHIPLTITKTKGQ
jgi:GTPase